MRQHETRERRLACYEAVMDQVRQGVTQDDIARRCGLGVRTVLRWIRAHGFPERQSTPRTTKVDRHCEYLRRRWQAGCHNASQLWRELRERGFTGESALVRNWIRKHYGPRSRRTKQKTSFSPATRASPQQTAWLLLKQPEDALPYLKRTLQPISANRHLCISGAGILWHDPKSGCNYVAALARRSSKELARQFCEITMRDEAALFVALQQPWSNGPVEGHIHRLKLIKRSMYGRAGFDLLRLRVVLAA